MVIYFVEIMAGDVFFYSNNLLCLLDHINWDDILTGEGAQVYDADNVALNNGGSRACKLKKNHRIEV